MPFKKGQSGNPLGRKYKTPVERNLERQAQHHTDMALGTLVKNLSCGTPAAEVAAAKEILDRGWGKAKQTLDSTVTHVVTDDRIRSIRDELKQKAPERLQLQ